MRFLGHAALGVGDADGALAFQQHLRRQGFGFDLQVGAVADRIEVAARAGPTFAVLLGDLEIAEPFLVAVVVVLVARVALVHRGVDERIQQFGAFPHVLDVQRAAAAARVVTARAKMFGLAEIGQHRVVAPAPVPVLRPCVVVERVAADIQHAVDGAGPAQGASTRDGNAPVIGVGFRFALEIPVIRWIVEQFGETGWDSDPHGAVFRTGFQQQHRGASVLAQAVCQHATGGTGAHDDVVELSHRLIPCL